MTDEPMVERLEEARKIALTGISTWKSEYSCGAEDDAAFDEDARLVDEAFSDAIALLSQLREQREALERVRAMLTDDESPHLCGRDEDSVDGIYVCKDCALAALAPDTEGEGP